MTTIETTEAVWIVTQLANLDGARLTIVGDEVSRLVACSTMMRRYSVA